jgi:hypothetical protein
MTRKIFYPAFDFVFLQSSCNSTTEEREISIGFSQSVGNDLWSFNESCNGVEALFTHQFDYL